MIRKSAGILAWRINGGAREVLLVHPGGPFFSNKDMGAWTIPKGEIEEGEEPFVAAKREFAEEVGMEIAGTFTELRPVVQKGGKVVYAWAVALTGDVPAFKSNTFAMEWPPRSGQMKEFPEADRAEWFGMKQAKEKINAAQVKFLEELEQLLHRLEI